MSNESEIPAQAGPFELAVIDVGSGPSRGDLTLARLRDRRQVGYGVLMSGSPPPTDLSAAAHMDEWLRKPFDLDDLHHLVKSARAR